VSTTFLTDPPIWTRRIANELWSGAVTPLTYSLLAEPMAEHMVRRPLRTAGLDGLAELPVLRHHASHVYVNARLLAATIRLLPGGLQTEGLLALLPETARATIGPGASWLSGTTQALAIAERAFRNEPNWAPWKRSTSFDRECVEVRRGFQKRGTFGAKPSVDELRAELVHVGERLGHYLDVVSWGMVFAYVFFHLVRELTHRWAPGEHADHAALTIGIPGVVSLEAHYDLHTLARLLRSDPAVAAALAAHEPATAGAILVRDEGTAGRGFRRFLEQHGHRLTGRDLSCPTWSESPAMVVELALAAGPDAALDRQSVIARRLAAMERIEAAFGTGPIGLARRTVFRPVLDYAQRYCALRENMRYHADFFLARLRQVALAYGATLREWGRIGAVEDVFWLDVEELVHAPSATTPLAERITARRAAAQHDAISPPPETLDHLPLGTDIEALATRAGGVLVGEIGAPGRSTGPARLVRGPDDFERVQTGDVLIAVYTDPGWTSVLERAAGLVLEAGGVLSHGAIVARELGIPALVGVADAMRAIHDGDDVELDADAGRLRIAAPARA
jgi:rifampicin phosphotransferase